MTDRKSGKKSASRSPETPPHPPEFAATVSHLQASIQTSRTGQPMASPSTSPESPVPKTFGRYKIEKELGKGAMGVVYLARDTQLDRQVALKIPKKSVLEESDALERFYREAKTTSQIRHPNICPVYDVGAIDGTHYLTMAYIPGKPVSSFVGKGKLPQAKQVALLIRKIALALEEAHKQGIVHRDLKPSNVMLDDRNEPIVMDFGLACQMNTAENARLTQSGAILGTPAYMAPEQVRGELDQIGPQSDIYALGVMMYQFLTGELPFSGPVMMVFAQIISNQPKLPSEVKPDVDRALEAISLKMMAKDISQRYASMKDVAAALTEYIKTGAVTGLEPTAMMVTPPVVDTGPNFENLPAFPGVEIEPRKSRSKRHAKSQASVGPGSRWIAAAGAAGVVLIALFAAVFYVQTGEGTVMVTVDDPSLKVTFNNREITFETDDSEPIKVRPGKHSLRVERDGLVTETLSFTLRRGEEKRLTVALAGDKPAFVDASVDPMIPQSEEQAEQAARLLAETAPTIAASDGWTDLLSTAERVQGSRWLTNEKNSLVGFGGGPKHIRSRLLLPVEPKGSYEVEVQFQLGAIPMEEILQMNLPVGEREVTFACLPRRPKRTGLGKIQGRIRKNQSDTDVTIHHEFELSPDTSYQLTASVSVNGDQGDVLISLDGEPWVSWNGPLTELSRGKAWIEPKQNALGLDFGVAIGKKEIATIIVSAIRYRELTGGPKISQAFPVGAPVVAKPTVVPLTQFAHISSEFVFTTAVSPDGKLVAGGHAKLTRIWNAADGSTLVDLKLEGPMTPRTLLFSPDNKYLVWGGWGNEEIRLYDVKTGEKVRTMDGNTGMIISLCFSADGRQLLSGGQGRKVGNGYDFHHGPNTRVWNVETGKQLRKFDSGNVSVGGCWLADNRRAVSRDGSASLVRLWDTETGKEELIYGRDLPDVWSVALSPNQEYVAASLKNNAVLVWDVATGKQVQRFEPANRAAFSPEGERILCSSANGASLRLWDVKSGIELLRVEDKLPDGIGAIHAFPAGDRALISTYSSGHVYTIPLTKPKTTTAALPPAVAPPPAIAPFNAEEALAHQEVWARHLGVPVEWENSIGMKFVLIPPGEFLMGSTPVEIEEKVKRVEEGQAKEYFRTLYTNIARSEGPLHRVILTKPFYLGVHEVRQKDYQSVQGTNPSFYSPSGGGKAVVAGVDTATFPVERVLWSDAAQFCRKLSWLETLRPYYHETDLNQFLTEGNGYRLPTEAEWEFASRAGTITKFWMGDQEADLLLAGWISKNSGDQSHPVMQLKANPFGLFDMDGNLWEWNQDWWSPTYYQEFQAKPAIDPAGPLTGENYRTIRGGDFTEDASHFRATGRGIGEIHYKEFRNVGFRVALSVDAVRQLLDREEIAETAAATKSLPVGVKSAHRGGDQWRYTFAKPGEGWMKPDFIDRDWKAGTSPFGIGWEGKPYTIRGRFPSQTEWKSKDIWLRKEFDAPPDIEQLRVVWLLFHDEAMECYLNGNRIVQRGGWTTTYLKIVKPPGEAMLKPGRNVIAVHCKNNGGPGCLDVGVYWEKP